jgi:glycosyltransferase involved in cell wall biosynthesis
MSSALGKLAARLRPDVVHAHYLPEYGWMAARERLAPLVCSAWGSDVLVGGWLNLHRSRRALAAADLVLADSAHLAQEARALAAREVPVEVVRWGLDLERYAPGAADAARHALGLAENGPLVAGVRGLRPVYNPELQLEAFARVRAGRPDAHFLLKHPLTGTPDRITATIDRLDLGDAVTVLGSLPENHLPDIYRAADVVLSIPSSDSSPRSVWEALACGRAVVVSDLPWAREELSDGENAVLVPLEADAVAAAVVGILNDPQLRDRLGASGRALAAVELDPAECSARIDALYRALVEARQ